MKMKYENIIKQMTLAEKARMMSGKNTWETVDFEKYGIPSMTMSDGPHGLRRQAGAGDHLGLNASLPATCFPTAAGVANSWDEALGEEIGEALAEEAVTMGVNVILGPGLNIKRSPLCGRNFEYFFRRSVPRRENGSSLCAWNPEQGNCGMSEAFCSEQPGASPYGE